MASNPRTALRFPRFERLNFTVEQYLTKVERGYWRLHHIQRNDSTWPEDHYRELVESIFNNILTSPFIGSAASELDVTILDGGHRTEAMRRFVEGRYKITCPTTGTDVYYHELSDEDKAIFNEKPLMMLIYPNLTPIQEETLFFRVNNSLPLSPGEIINGYMSVPMCVLARQLGERFVENMHESFRNCIGVGDLRAESSNVMLMILRNFQHGRIVIGEKPSTTKKEELKNVCERLRTIEINEEALTHNVEVLFNIIRGRKSERYLLMILPTIQAIMMNYGVGSLDNYSMERVRTYAELISTFFLEIENPELTYTLNRDYQSLMRSPNDTTIRGVQNPSTPNHCVRRAALFTRWLEFKDITPP